MWAVSIPAMVAAAEWKDLKPIIGRGFCRKPESSFRAVEFCATSG